MAGEWRTMPLSELTDPDTPVTYGVVKPGPEDPDGVPFIRGGDIANGRVLTDQLRTITREVSEQYRRTLLRGGEIVVSLVGNPGQVAIVPKTLKGANIARQAGLVRLRDGVDTHFVKYFLSSRMGQEALGAHSLGSVQQVINLRDLKTIQVPLPPLAEQRAIAHILSTLDDKIELNRRTNETLEAMAQALFKSWFVDFDPVCAKAKGRDTRVPGAIAHLFPDTFEDSEFGEIPQGWRLSHIGAEAETLLGGTPSRGEPAYWGGDVPWINSGKANEFRIVEPSEYITQAGLESSATKLLPSRTTVIAITGATLGQVSITEIPTCANQSIVGVLGSAELPSEYIYFWVKENIDRLIASQTGGAQQHINKNNVNELPIVCPDGRVIRAYMATAFPIFERIKNSCFESRALAVARDTLLPKLISGELRVKNAEQFIRRLS